MCNLNVAVTEFDLRQLFQACGDVDSVLVTRDKLGASKGWALVKFKAEVRIRYCRAVAAVNTYYRCLRVLHPHTSTIVSLCFIVFDLALLLL